MSEPFSQPAPFHPCGQLLQRCVVACTLQGPGLALPYFKDMPSYLLPAVCPSIDAFAPYLFAVLLFPFVCQLPAAVSRDALHEKISVGVLPYGLMCNAAAGCGHPTGHFWPALPPM